MKTIETAIDETERAAGRTSSVARRHWPRIAIIPALVALGMGLSACGGGSPGGSSGSPGSSSTPGSSNSSGLFAKALKYAQCMRSHGVASFPDPTVGTNGMPNFNFQSNGNSDLNPNSSQWKAAQSVCRKDLPNGGVQTPAQKAAAKGKALKYTACMRAHGEPDFPDPNSTGTIQLSTPTGILNPTSPQFKEATKACEKLDTGFSESVRAVAPGPGPSSPPGSGGAGS